MIRVESGAHRDRGTDTAPPEPEEGSEHTSRAEKERASEEEMLDSGLLFFYFFYIFFFSR